MASSKPLVSIGMPTYNGSQFICQTLDSLIAQDYEHFELIVSDNASTDGTWEICQEYSARYKKIHCYRNETNLGAIKNFNRVLELSHGKYFMWAGAHDLWHPTFISRCASILEEEPEVVLAYPRTILIDIDGNPLGLMPDQIDTRGMSAIHRYKYLLWNLHCCNMVYGIIRRKALILTGGFRDVVWGPDHALLADLALQGPFAQIVDPLYYRRKNREDEDLETRKKRTVLDLDPINAHKKSKEPVKNLNRELRNAHLKIVLHAPLSLFEKLHAALATVEWFRDAHGVQSRSLLFAEIIRRYLIPKRLFEKFR